MAGSHGMAEKPIIFHGNLSSLMAHSFFDNEESSDQKNSCAVILIGWDFAEMMPWLGNCTFKLSV
mgnify:CR=1 FL=1